jgi:hypothetical protein
MASGTNPILDGLQRGGRSQDSCRDGSRVMRGHRISQSVRLGPFRLWLSVPVGKGRPRVGASTRDGIGRIGVSAPVSGKRKKRT